MDIIKDMQYYLTSAGGEDNYINQFLIVVIFRKISFKSAYKSLKKGELYAESN